MSGFVVFQLFTTGVNRSSNGSTWFSSTLPAGLDWIRGAWNGSVFAIIGNNSATAYTSPDAVTWTSRTIQNRSWTGIAWNGSVFCAVADGNTTTDCSTSPDGITWTNRTVSSASFWKDIAWNGSVFCAVASNTNKAMTSPDGTTWTGRTLPTTDDWCYIKWNGSVFCAISNYGAFATSPDGTTWTTRTSPNTGVIWAGMAVNGTTFCIVDNDNTGVSYTSTNGITWNTGSYTVTANQLTGLAGDGTYFITPKTDTNIALRSTDGLTWTNQTLATTGTWTSVVAGNISAVTAYNETVSESLVMLGELYRFYIYISETLNIIADGTGLNSSLISEIISYSESLLFSEITTIAESILCYDVSTSKQTMQSLINDYFVIVDTIFIKYLLTISESIVYTPDLIGAIKQIEEIVSAVSISDSLSTKQVLLSNIIDLLTILDYISSGINKTVLESIIINDTLSQLQKFINTLTESINISSTNIVIFKGIERLLSTLNLSEEEDNIVEANSIIDEEFIISIPTASGQDNYLAYLLSPETNSVTNYNNYNFKGSTKFNNKYLLYSGVGLYEYGGTTDAGTTIELDITTAALDFGSTNLKQVPSIYLGITNNSAIYLKANVDGKVNCLYKLNKRTENLHTQKIDTGKGLIGRYFQFELISTASEFELESIDFYPIELKRKL
jgi:hypothetical protein